MPTCGTGRSIGEPGHDLTCNQQCASAEAADVKILGVDDCTWRRGHRYGTVLLDLERHEPIDLLPDREAVTLARWPQAHPTVHISGDRAGPYADGARQGASDAMQVADRFPLLCNLTQALQRRLERLAHSLQRLQLWQSQAVPARDLESIVGRFGSGFN